MLRKVQFHGPFADELGDRVRKFNINTPQQWLNACRSQVKGFDASLRQHPTGHIVLRNSETGKIREVSMSTLSVPFDDYDEVHVLPATAGGWEAAAYFAVEIAGTTAGTAAYYAVAIVAFIAISYAIAAVSMALAPSPDTGSGAEKADQRPSRLYNGPVNVVQQGYPVPLVYGTHMTGSIVVSAGIRVEDIAYVPPTPPEASPPPEDWQWTGSPSDGGGA